MTPTLAPPYRSHSQRMDALARANWVRVHRARRKRELAGLSARASRRCALGWIVEPPAELETMTIYALLLACPGVGRVKANRMIKAAKVSPTRTLAGLTERQQLAIAEVLDLERGPTPMPGQLGLAA